MQILATNLGGKKYVTIFSWNKLLGQMGKQNILNCNLLHTKQMKMDNLVQQTQHININGHMWEAYT